MATATSAIGAQPLTASTPWYGEGKQQDRPVTYKAGKRSAQAREGRRRQGSKPDGRDSVRGAGRCPRARRRHAVTLSHCWPMQLDKTVMDTASIFDIASFNLDRIEAPFVMPWPQPGDPAARLIFRHFPEWQTFIVERGLHPAIPRIVSDKYRRAQRLYVLAWLDTDLVKAGELVALTALELALTDRYGGFLHQRHAQAGSKRKRRQAPMLHDLLAYLVDDDGLTDAQLPFTQRYGGSIVPVLRRGRTSSSEHSPRPTLAEIRNALAHGDPFDGLPWSGLLELVRDLIEYAYRSYVHEARVGRGR